MKHALNVLAGLAVALAGGLAQASGDFEGEVDMTMTTNNGKTLPMQYFVKGHRMRVKTSASNNDNQKSFSGSAIFDWQTNQMTLLMDQQKMYMVNQLHPEKWNYDSNGKHFKITDTGNSETILGHNCEEWDYTSDDNNGKVWLAPGIGHWWGTEMAAQSGKLSADQRALVNLAISKKLFPMKWETDDKSGKVKNTGVVTKVEAKSLDDSFFEPPADYKKFDMANMFNGAGQSSGSAGSSSNPSNSNNQDPLSAVKPKLPF